MHILLTNDDGIDAPGLWHLHDALRHWRCDIAAPAQDQSGASHSSACLRRPLTVTPVTRDGVTVVAVAGTPSDAVKFRLCTGTTRYDVVVSGINAGENSGVAHFYSGTVAAAREAALRGVPAVAASVWRGTPERYREAGAFLRAWLPRWVADARARGGAPMLLNVNFPDADAADWRGVHVARQSTAYHDDRFVAGDAQDHVLAMGDRHAPGIAADSDDWALRRGHVTITPLRLDVTCDAAGSWLRALHPPA